MPKPPTLTTKQQLGAFGEQAVARRCPCPHCKRPQTLKRLPPNFRCADLICDFCGFLAQVKTSAVTDIDKLPATILGAAWPPQQQRMQAGIYVPLFLVLTTANRSAAAIHYLSADLQTPEMFKPRTPLSDTAKRAGWQGFLYDLTTVETRFVRLA